MDSTLWRSDLFLCGTTHAGDARRPFMQVLTGMPPWRLRDFHDDDLDQAICVWDQGRTLDESHPVFGVSEVISAARSGQPAVVAVIGDDLVGMAAHSCRERARPMVALSSRRRNRGRQCPARRAEIRCGRRRAADQRPAARGCDRDRRPAQPGYTERTELSYFEKVDHVGAADAGLLATRRPSHAGWALRRWPAWKRRSKSSSGASSRHSSNRIPLRSRLRRPRR